MQGCIAVTVFISTFILPVASSQMSALLFRGWQLATEKHMLTEGIAEKVISDLGATRSCELKCRSMDAALCAFPGLENAAKCLAVLHRRHQGVILLKALGLGLFKQKAIRLFSQRASPE